MNMKQSMVFVFVVLLLLAYQDASAQQTQSPWLIGRWDEILKDLPAKAGQPGC